MARKLKTFTTSAGFFDLAVAAPSMKAALEAWGATRNLFHQGFAKESDDPDIVEATMAKPGVVLRRPVGTNVAFSEHADLPRHLTLGKGREPVRRRTTKRPTTKPVDDKAARAAAQAFDREQKRRQAQERKEEVTRAKQQERQDRAVATAQAALDEAKRDHKGKVEDMEKARAALDRKFEAEAARWKKKEGELEAALRRARSPTHLRLIK